MKTAEKFEHLETALSMGREQLFAKIDSEMSAFRRKLLIELANLDTSHRKIQTTLELFEGENNAMIASAQRDLRAIWPRSVPVLDKQRVVDAWLAATKRAGRAGINAWLGRGRLEFDFRSFPGQFVMAILENWWRFQVCANPECAASYFLAKRNTQRYCERGECTRYANQRYARTYWKTKGKARRSKKEEQ